MSYFSVLSSHILHNSPGLIFAFFLVGLKTVHVMEKLNDNLGKILSG